MLYSKQHLSFLRVLVLYVVRHCSLVRILWHTMLPNVLYTVIISPLFYWLTRGVVRLLKRRV